MAKTRAQARAAASRSVPSLLELPPEVRNLIYRFALQEPTPVDITDKGFAKPGLLTASQAIRSETLGIYYLENTFPLRIDNHDPAKVVRLHEIENSKRLGTRIIEVEVRIREQPDWTHLVRWLWHWHRMETNKYLSTNFAAPERKLIGALFYQVREMRAQPWSTVVGTLRPLCDVLVSINSKWAVEGDDK